MLDVMWLALMCVPIVTGLFFVLRSLKEHSRAAAVPRMASEPASPEPAPGRFAASQAATRP